MSSSLARGSAASRLLAVLLVSSPTWAEEVANTVLVENKRIAISTFDIKAERRALLGPQTNRADGLGPPLPEASSLLNQLYERKTFAAFAVEQGLDQQDWVQARLAQARDRVLAEAAVEHQRAELLEQLPDMSERALETYRAKPEQFKREPRVRVAHILLATDSDQGGESKTEEAEALRERILAGESFAELAESLSIDEQSAKSGGELPWFGTGKMVPEFEQAAFALTEPGAISEPVVTQFGVHLIQLLERDEGGPIAFDEIKASLSSKLQVDWLKAEMQRWRMDLAGPGSAKVHEEALEAYLATQQPTASPQQP